MVERATPSEQGGDSEGQEAATFSNTRPEQAQESRQPLALLIRRARTEKEKRPAHLFI